MDRRMIQMDIQVFFKYFKVLEKKGPIHCTNLLVHALGPLSSILNLTNLSTFLNVQHIEVRKIAVGESHAVFLLSFDRSKIF